MRPILSGDGLSVSSNPGKSGAQNSFQDDDNRIRMETLCSLVLGRDGNHGYNFVGRFSQTTREEMLSAGNHLRSRNFMLITFSRIFLHDFLYESRT